MLKGSEKWRKFISLYCFPWPSRNAALGALFALGILRHAQADVIFGSDFPGDRTDLTICLQLQRIKVSRSPCGSAYPCVRVSYFGARFFCLDLSDCLSFDFLTVCIFLPLVWSVACVLLLSFMIV